MWRFITASVTGESHRRLQLGCQDRSACRVLAGGTLIAAVADGAGSAIMAERGADIVVRSVMDYLERHAYRGQSEIQEILLGAAEFAREEITSVAHQEGEPLSGYASTLLAAIVTPNGGGAMQLGDGAIVVSTGNDEWAWVFWPHRGEYANTTYFLTDDRALERLQIDVFGGEEAVMDIALLSDGLEPLALHQSARTVHDPFFNGFIKELLKEQNLEGCSLLSQRLSAFLSSGPVTNRTDDDVSLVVATRRNYERPE